MALCLVLFAGSCVCVLSDGPEFILTDFALCIVRLGISRSVADVRIIDVQRILTGKCAWRAMDIFEVWSAGVVLPRPVLFKESPGWAWILRCWGRDPATRAQVLCVRWIMLVWVSRGWPWGFSSVRRTWGGPMYPTGGIFNHCPI